MLYHIVRCGCLQSLTF